MAVLSGAGESVRLHLRAGADLDATDSHGRTALILAVSRGHLDVCKLLLEAGADPAIKDSEGKDALAVARSFGETGIAELLHGVGAPTSVPGDSSRSDDRRQADERSGNEACPTYIGIGDRIGEASAVYLIAAAGESNQANGCVLEDGAFTKPRLDNHDEFDLSGWQEEIETEAPPDDLSCAGEAVTLQEAVSRHNPIDTDESWDDVEIDLPELEYLGRYRSRVGTETRTAVRVLVLEALRTGRVDGNRVRSALMEDDELEDTKRTEIEANLRLVLRDAGVVIDDESSTIDAAAEITEEDEERFGDVATQAIELLARLQSSDVDPLASYFRSLPTDLLTRDDETALGIAIEEGIREVLVTIAGSQAVVSRLLSDARSVMEGNISVRALFDTTGAQEDEDEISSNDTIGDQENEPERSVAPIQSALSAHLQAIVDLCQRREVDSTALAARLFDVGLSAEYRETLQCIAEQDSACENATKRISVGLRKVTRAKRRFVETNLKLVIWVARKHGGLPLADRIQAGNMGLMRAVDRFDYRRGTKFSTYAVWWIRQSITRTVADTARIIRVPVHVTESLRKVERARVLAYAKDGCDSDVDLIATLAELPPDRVRKMFAVPEDPLPMDDPGVVEEVCTVPDERAPPPEEVAMVAQMQDLMKHQLDQLVPREATVLRRRFGIDCDEHTLEEVGKEFDVTRERIRQIEAKALRKLRHPIRTEGLRDFLR